MQVPSAPPAAPATLSTGGGLRSILNIQGLGGTQNVQTLDPASIVVIAGVLIEIGFKIYEKHSAITRAQREQLVADMKSSVQWRTWATIEPDATVQALPAPTE